MEICSDCKFRTEVDISNFEAICMYKSKKVELVFVNINILIQIFKLSVSRGHEKFATHGAESLLIQLDM